MHPLVSIIIPNYNHSKYLDKRIQSCLNQTFQSFEIIILDDCSTDNSKEVIEKYRNNPKVSNIIYNKNNSGSTFIQWNKGFELAKGEYIWIAESDDFCERNFLYTLVQLLIEKKDLVLAFTYSQFVDSNDKIIPPIITNHNKNKIIKGHTFISLRMTSENMIWNASSALFKKEVLKTISQDYTQYKAAGDRLFWIEIAMNGNVGIICKPLNYFRQHTEKVSPKKIFDGTLYKEDYEICNILKAKGYINKINLFFIRNHYIYDICRNNLESEELRNKLLKMWGYSKPYNKKTLAFIEYFYQRIKHYISILL